MVTPFPPSPGDAPTRAVQQGGDAGDRPVPPPAGPADRTPADRTPADRTPEVAWRPGPFAPSPGDRLGAYRLDRVVGEGGMGVVYLGLDDEHRAVALKVLKPHIAADPHARRRLAREVETLERVRSPRVAEVLSADVDGQWPHLVTRYVPGPSLEAVVESRGPLRGSRLRDLGHGLAEALRAIHAVDVVHRDLKPSNVLLLDGMPVVIDFGIAHVADDVRLTSVGLVMGTPGYLSPEVVAGAHVSAATDWWGWAATVAYAASGRPPFGTGPMEVVLDRVRRADVDLRGIPAALQGPVLAALAVDPARRPHPDALLAALDGATTGPQPLDGATATVPTGDRPPAGPGAAGPAAGPDTAGPDTAGRSRFASLMAPETSALPLAGATGTGAGAGESAAEATSVLRPVAPPTTPVPAAPGQGPRWSPPGAQQAPPGWIPRTPGPGVPQPYPTVQDPTVQDVFAHPAPPAGSAPAARPAAQAPRLGTNGEPARPQRSWTLLAGLVALTGVFAVAPTAGVLIALVAATVARTVDRACAGLFRRRWEAGPRSSDGLAVAVATPWHVLRAALTTVLCAVVPVLVGLSVAFLVSTFAPTPALAAGRPLVLALGGLLGSVVGWNGPGNRSLQRGARTVVRATLRTERATGIAVGVLLLVALAAVLVVTGGGDPDWRPLTSSPLGWL